MPLNNYRLNALPPKQDFDQERGYKSGWACLPSPIAAGQNLFGESISGFFWKRKSKSTIRGYQRIAGHPQCWEGGQRRWHETCGSCLLGRNSSTLPGDSAVSLSGLVAQSLIKGLRGSHVGLRGSVLRSLSLLITGLGSSIDENVARDIWKAARNAASNDKAALVQKYAFECLRALCSSTSYFNNSTDFENLQSTAWRSLDSAVAGVRHAVAKAMAAACTAAFSDTNATDVPVIPETEETF